MVTSCVNEREIGFGKIGKDEIAFVIGDVQTKATAKDFSFGSETVNTIEVGDGLVLEETVVSLNGGPETKGTPAFTENVATLYGSFNAVANPNDPSKSLADASFPFNQGTTLWSHAYPNQGIWEKTPLTFYMRMPATPAGVTSDYTYGNDGSIEFDYKSPESATGQQDILFTSTTINDADDLPKSITFYHALTGIKFSNFYTNKAAGEGKKTVKTIIKSVTISGIQNTGTCVVDPSAETIATWTLPDTSRTSFTIEPNGDTTNYKGSTYKLNELLDKNATARNLNDVNGSLTFWLIPQDLTKTVKDSVTLTVRFDIELDGKKTFENKELTVCLSTKLFENHRQWQAGQLHTFTLKPTAVGVDIDDELTEYVKSDVVVKNTGNVYEYVRVNMIGNWMGLVCSNSSGPQEDATLTYPQDKPENYVILMGYPNNAKNSDGEYTAQKLINPWNDKDFYSDGSFREVEATSLFMSPYPGYGTFVGLPCMADEPEGNNPAGPGGQVGNWIRHDKYYYYMNPIGPGDSITEDLFESYTIGVSPAFWIADKYGTRRPATHVHFEMDLTVQAIEAPMEADGVTPAKTYLEAWTSVLNPDGDDDFNINDL